MKLSLVVPIYNEANHLEQFLTQLDALALNAEKELVFVDDCSKDKSWGGDRIPYKSIVQP